MGAADRYCSLGDDRSWTDIVTNVTQLSAARVEEDFDALMGWGSVPRKLLPGFLTCCRCTCAASSTTTLG